MDDWYLHATVFAANWMFIGLKSFQQRNVAFDNFYLIVPTSMLLAVAEVYVVAQIAVNGWRWDLVLTLGLAGGTGSLMATLFHKRHVLKGADHGLTK